MRSEEKMTNPWRHGRIELFLRRVFDSDPEHHTTGWEDVLVPEGAAHWAVATNDERALSWARRWTAHHLGEPIAEEQLHIASYTTGKSPIRGIKLYGYCGNWGAPLALAPLLAIETGSAREEMLGALRRVADFIVEGSHRDDDGVILHGPSVPAVWVDTLYYTAAPLAAAFTATGETRYAREAFAQCILHAKHLRDDTTGLFFHDAQVSTGLRTHWFWARGNGWIIMALAEALAACPLDTEGREEVLMLYRSIVTGLLRLQHESGLWRIIPENPESHLETSGTAMILRGVLRGIVEGWIEESTIVPVLRGVRELATYIRPDGPAAGALMGSERPAGRGGWERHKFVELGECSYTTGTFLSLLALLRIADVNVESIG